MRKLNLGDLVQGVAAKVGVQVNTAGLNDKPAHSIAKSVGIVTAKTVNGAKNVIDDVKNMGSDIKAGFLAGLKEGYNTERRKP